MIQCTNLEKVDIICKEEPPDFYEQIYEILFNDVRYFGLHSFKHLYVICKLPLYNTHVFGEEIKFIEEYFDNCSLDIKENLFNGMHESFVGHSSVENFQKSTFNITSLNIKTCGHITHNITHQIHALENNISVKNFDLIFEFGAGYGGMAKLCNDLGYKNKYYIFDLPRLKDIQTYYLTRTSVSHKIVNDISSLKTEIGKFDDNKKKLFIATWSLSEVNLDLRALILDIIKDFDAFIIIFQKNIWGVDNGSYFDVHSEFCSSFKKITKFTRIPISYINFDGGNYYLIGSV